MTKKALERRLLRQVARDPLLRAVRDAGRETGVAVWLVGGFIRDAALGRRAEDIDLVAGHGARSLVRRLEIVWKRRAFRFRKRGVTTWRVVTGGREVDLVDAARRGLREDLRRRELTINAIALDLGRGRLEDPLGGLRDLRAGRLRLPRPGVFREDPVRALRAARFLAELPSFRLERGARREAAAASRSLRRASIERIRDELDRLLVSIAPERGLEELERLGLVGSVLPELLPLASCVAGRDRPSVWRHTLDSVASSVKPRGLPGSQVVRDFEGARILRWALLLHDIAKPDTLTFRPDGRPTFHGHEVMGARRAAAILGQLRVPGDLRRRVSRLILFHLRPHQLADEGAPDRGMRRLVREAGEDLPLLVLHAACDARASGAPDAAVRWRRLRPVLLDLLSRHRSALEHPLPRLVGGRDVMLALGLPSGPAIGRVLREVRELQEEGVLRDRPQALAFLATRSP